MTVTKILGAQSGIQYQSVQDKSEADPRDHLVNALFTGEFKRGPFNKPFKVTQANIRARLGFDPDNLQYQTIEDCLKKVPFVWVMRIDTELKWGPWQINEMNILGAIARFIGSKTNTLETYNGSAQIDLTVAITASLSDSNMQRWQAVTDACNELTGVTDWTFDTANGRVKYMAPPSPFSGYAFRLHVDPYWNSDAYYREVPEDVIADFYTYIASENAKNTNTAFVYSNARLVKIGENSFELHYDGYIQQSDGYRYNYCTSASTGHCTSFVNSKQIAATAPKEQTLSYSAIAQKVISNASSSDQGISLLAETYIQEVAKGVTLDNLIDQFEQTKIKI